MEKENALPGDIAAARILFILSISVGVAIIGLGIIWPLIPVYALDMGATGFQLGMIVSPVFSGIVMDSMGLPSIFFIGCILIMIGSIVIFAFLRNLPEEGATEVRTTEPQ